MTTTSKLLFSVLITALPACSVDDPPPPWRGTDGGWSTFDIWLPQLDAGPTAVDAEASRTDTAPAADTRPPAPPAPPVEQSPPVPGASCTGNLTAEGTRWVKKGAGPQGIYPTPKLPGTNPSSLASVPEGGALKYFPTASKPGWACVLFGGAAGYIDANALTTVAPTGTKCKPGLTLSGYRWVKAGTDALNLRSVPSADAGNATVIEVIPEGASHKAAYFADGDEPGWACLEYAGKTGYASAKYLATEPPAPSSGSPGSSPGTSDSDPGSAFCTANPEVTWCGPLTKPCGWRSTKGECESVHWFTGLFNQNAKPCCSWVYK
jgi:hypothetical protein